jgi:hypothetical protein
MRKTLYAALTGAAPLTALVPPERWFQAGAVTDVPPTMFVVLRWLSPVPSSARGRFLNQLRIDVHDRRGSYSNIDAFLGSPDVGNGVYGVMNGILQLDGIDGRITQCDYLGHSGDQEDETYGTNYKFSSWQVIGVNK